MEMLNKAYEHCGHCPVKEDCFKVIIDKCLYEDFISVNDFIMELDWLGGYSRASWPEKLSMMFDD